MASLLDNFWLKIVGVVMGLLLWFHVATEKTYNHEIRLPLTEISLEDSLTLANTPPDSVTVSVNASGKRLLRSKWRENGVRLMANQYVVGRHAVSLSTTNVSLAATGNQVVIDAVVSPATVTLNIDRLAEAEVDVELDLVIETADGFAISRIGRPSPERVTVRGARQLVQQQRTVSTVRREVSAVRTNLTLRLPVVAPEGYGITVEPDTVVVDVEVVPVKTRVFENVPIVVYNVPQGSQATIHPRVINIELTGPPAEIDLLNRNALVASVDYRHLDSAGSAPIKIDAPGSFRVKRASSEEVIFDTTANRTP